MPIEKLTQPHPTAERQAALRDAVLDALRTHAPEALADDNIHWEVLQEALTPPRADADDEAAPPDDAERFGLFWHGKRAARKLAASPSRLALHPAPGEGVNEASTRNLYLEGDNLEVLKLLQKAYAGRVKMIYIDPPYNTGNDFVYKDDYRDSADDYLRKTGQMGEGGELLSSNPKASGRFHSNWLNMIYPRLMLARQLLREDGVIFVSIDDNEVHNLRQVMDEVFGAENFIADIVVANNLKGRNDKRYIATAHERLLIFGKFNFEEIGLNLPEETIAEYAQKDSLGSYRLLGLRKRGGADTRKERPRMFFPFYVDPQTEKVYLSKNKVNFIEVLPRKSDGSDGCWRWGTETAKLNLDLLVSKIVGSPPRYDIFEKDYLETDGEIRRLKPKSIWAGANYSTDSATKAYRSLMQDIDFPSPKPVSFLVDLIIYSTHPTFNLDNSAPIILDFFSGSATTAHAVLAQNVADGGNRRFIMVQLPEATGRTDYPTIAEIGKERIRRVIAKLQSERDAAKPSQAPALQGSLALADADDEAESVPAAHGHLDLGFKVFKLGPSNVQAWQPFVPQHNGGVQDLFAMQAQLAQAQSPLVAGWQAADVLAEVMLIEGFALDADVRQQPIFAHNTVWLVQSEACAHRLFVCLDPSLHSHSIDEAAHSLRSADVWICLDSALSDQAKLRLSDVCKVRVI